MKRSHMRFAILTACVLMLAESSVYSQKFVLPVATEEVINAPVQLEYPKPAAGIPDTPGLSSRRPVPTMSPEELQRKPVSTHAARFPLVGTWKAKSNSLSFIDAHVMQSENYMIISFESDGKFIQEITNQKYNTKMRYEGQWRVVDNLLELYNVVNKTRTAYSGVRNVKIDDAKVMLRWYDDNSFEMFSIDLDSMAFNALKTVPNATSVSYWYDERGNFITKTDLKIDILGAVKETTSYQVKGRELYRRQ